MVADMQVWLDTQVDAGQTIVVPYVKSGIDRHMRYRLEVSKSGVGGTSRIRQGGNVHAAADQVTALSRTAIDVKPDDACTIELVLSEKDVPVATFHFDCPR
jgi:hypothetical protein